MIAIVLNILWIIFGGLGLAIGWAIAGAVMILTVVGIPWAFAAFRIAWHSLLPFGQGAMRRDVYRRREDIGSGPLGTLGNIIWLVLAGWWLALYHLSLAVGLAITIIGLPFAWAHLKLAGLALWPIGMEIVPYDDRPPGGGWDVRRA